MNPATEILLRRAASQAVTLARANVRCVFTDQRHERAATTAAATATVEIADTIKTINDLPGPDGVPVIGTLPEYFRKPNRGQMHEVQRRFHEKYGRIFKERLGPVTNLSIADPQLVEEIFRKEGKYPNRPAYEAWLLYKDMRKRSKGIMSASGEEWRKIRTLLNHSLMKSKQMPQYVSDINTISNELVDKLTSLRDLNTKDNSVPNILNAMYSWSIESIGQVLLDERFGCLQQEQTKMNEFVASIENMMYTSHQLMVFSNVHKRFNSKIWRTHVQSWDVIIEVAKNILDAKKAVIESRVENGTTHEHPATIFEHFLADESLTMEEIYTNMTELLLSGVDTTSNTVAVALYLLSRHPEVQARLQAEVDNIDTSQEGFTAEHLKNMPYTKAVTKEVMRLFPTVPTNARVLDEDTYVDGYLIPEKTIVMLNTFTMCRNPDEFNKPDDFIPERWLRNEVREFSPFTSLPFGFGARSCVGRRVAEAMVHMGIANIAKRFDIRPIETSTEVKPFVRTVLTLGDDLPVELYDR